MDWKHIVMPQSLRRALKWARAGRSRHSARLLDLLLRAGRPAELARALRDRPGPVRAVLFKQGILSLAGPDRFYRYARGGSGAAKLEREHEGWRLLRGAGLGGIVVPAMRLERLGRGVLLETPLLRPVALENQVETSRPLIAALVRAARPMRHRALPPTVAAGLDLVRRVAGGTVPESFVSEVALREAFSAPLLTGISHRDLHCRNVMRGEDGRPVLIDLKSCAPEQVLALDLLIFACKYLAIRDRVNVVEHAFELQRLGWDMPALEPVLSLIDLPRPLWGPAVTLHALGQVDLRRSEPAAPPAVLGGLLRRLLQRDWRAAKTGAPRAPSDEAVAAPGQAP
jgi:hypothetical protein